MIVGREKEQRELMDLYESGKSEFIAIYGRRRVGKTFLINETFKNNIAFRHTGLPPIQKAFRDTSFDGNLKRQMEAFTLSLLNHGYKIRRTPTSWLEAFGHLAKFLQSLDSKRKVVFIDELPWLDTPKSYFIEALSYFWNNCCCFNSDIMLVVCGSSSSWILDNVIHNIGGLYGRVTYQIRLLPFSLKETESFFESQGFEYSRYEIVQAYMAVGGIPYYLNYFKRGLSIPQNLDNIFYNENANLSNEFIYLFSSQFTSYEKYVEIVEHLSKKNIGFSGEEIAIKIGSSCNGELYSKLYALEMGGFVKKYVPFSNSKRNTKYKLIDPFCLFYLKNIKGNENKNDFFQNNYNTQRMSIWRGYAFENVCFNHIKQIKWKLGIVGVDTSESSWFSMGNDEEIGAQIDLIIYRKDNVVNLCEIKFYSEEFKMNKEYHLKLENKRDALRNGLPKRISIQNVLITTFGLVSGGYSFDFPNVITLEDLFR